MILDDKIKYFKRNLDDDGNFTLSDEMNFDELFDMEMLEYLNNAKFYFILKSEHWIKLLKNGANNQQYMNNVVEMICKNWSFKMQQDKFDELMSDNNVAESFIKALGVLISNDNYMLKSIVSRTIVNNDNLLNYILNGSLINADKKFFSNIISSK